MSTRRNQGNKKRYITRDHSKDDDLSEEKNSPVTQTQHSLEQPSTPKQHHTQVMSQQCVPSPQHSDTYPKHAVSFTQHVEHHRQQQGRQVIRSPSLNSPRTCHHSPQLTAPFYSEYLSPSDQLENRPSENLAALAPRSPRSLKRANTERLIVSRSSAESPFLSQFPHHHRQCPSPQGPCPQQLQYESAQSHYPYSSSYTTSAHATEQHQKPRIYNPMQTPQSGQFLPAHESSPQFPQQLEPLPRVHNDPYRISSNEIQPPSRQISRASAESDSSFNRYQTSTVYSPPLSGSWKSPTGSVSSFTQQIDDNTLDGYKQYQQPRQEANPQWQEGSYFEHLRQPQMCRYPSRSPTNSESYRFSHGVPKNSGDFRYSSPSAPAPTGRYGDVAKTRSSSLTDTIPITQPSIQSSLQEMDFKNTPPRAPFFHKLSQNQSIDSSDLGDQQQKTQLVSLKPRSSFDSEFTIDGSGNINKNEGITSAVTLRPPKENLKSDDSQRHSFYDNDAHPGFQHTQQNESNQTNEFFPSPGNTWKSQTAPPSFSIFKRPTYGRMAKVIPPHLIGVFDPRKYLPAKQPSPRTSANDHNRPSSPLSGGSTSSNPHPYQTGRQNSNVNFRYSDPTHHYDISDIPPEPDNIVRRGSDEKRSFQPNPKQLNQFLSLSTGPWSREKSLFGRANTVNETRKLETNWKKYEDYQNLPPATVAKGQTQKQLDEHVKLLEKIKQQKQAKPQSVLRERIHNESQKSSLSRSHDSIDSSQGQLNKLSKDKVFSPATTKARSQELPLNRRELSNGCNNMHRHPENMLAEDQSPSNTQFPTGNHMQSSSTCVSIKQVTLNVPEEEIITLASASERSPLQYQSVPLNKSENFTSQFQADSATPTAPVIESPSAPSTQLHTSRLLFHPASSMSPKMLRRELQTSELKQEEPKQQRSSNPDLGLEFKNPEKTDQNSKSKYITSMTIPESELFKPSETNKWQTQAEENKIIGTPVSSEALHYPMPFIVSSESCHKNMARRTKSDATQPGGRPAFLASSNVIETPKSANLPNSFQPPQENKSETSYFTFPSLSETPQSTSAVDSDTAKSAIARIESAQPINRNEKISRNAYPSNECPLKLAVLCEEFLNDAFTDQEQTLKSSLNDISLRSSEIPAQSSELSSSNSSISLSLGESSFAAFCSQQLAGSIIPDAEHGDKCQIPTHFDVPANENPEFAQQATTTAVGPTTPSSASSIKKFHHPLTKQDSFNTPDSPLFHKTLPLPKDSVILHHRRHHLKECASFQSSSSSSEDSELENFSALRLTPRRPRRTKQRGGV